MTWRNPFEGATEVVKARGERDALFEALYGHAMSLPDGRYGTIRGRVDLDGNNPGFLLWMDDGTWQFARAAELRYHPLTPENAPLPEEERGPPGR